MDDSRVGQVLPQDSIVDADQHFARPVDHTDVVGKINQGAAVASQFHSAKGRNTYCFVSLEGVREEGGLARRLISFVTEQRHVRCTSKMLV